MSKEEQSIDPLKNVEEVEIYTPEEVAEMMVVFDELLDVFSKHNLRADKAYVVLGAVMGAIDEATLEMKLDPKKFQTILRRNEL